MKHPLTTVASASLLGSLMACAPAPTTPDRPTLVEPAEPAQFAGAKRPLVVVPQTQTTPVMSPVELEFAKARAAHGRGELVEAAAHYQRVLEQAPQHVGALNGVGVIHAQAGRTELALQMFDRARQLAPQAAHLYNNAGYALLQAGRLEEARAQLSRALALDPASALARQNLELLARAEALASPVAASASPLVAVAPNVYELRSVPAEQAVQTASVLGHGLRLPAALQRDGQAAALSGLRGVRLEVSNGVGVPRLARKTAERLAQSGMVSARLTNAKPYRQARTEIQYAPGQTLPAQALQSRLPWAAMVVATGPIARGAQLRLVLGHDLDRRELAAWLGHPRGTMTAQLAPAGGWILG